MAPGGGGMNPGGGGGGGKLFGGPTSPVSLPPFHESLIKSGGNCYSAQYNNQYHLMMNDQLCFNNNSSSNGDTGQNPAGGGGVPFAVGLDGGPAKQYSMLQNASSLDIDIKQDDCCEDLSSYVKEPNGFDTLMADSENGTSNDPMQFTATLTFAGPTDPDFLDSLNDAAELFFKEVNVTFVRALPAAGIADTSLWFPILFDAFVFLFANYHYFSLACSPKSASAVLRRSSSTNRHCTCSTNITETVLPNRRNATITYSNTAATPGRPRPRRC